MLPFPKVNASTTRVQLGNNGTEFKRPQSSSQSMPLPSSPPASNSSSMSSGATAGIAVGAAAFALLVASLVFFLLRRKKQKKSAINGAFAEEAPEGDSSQELSDSGINEMPAAKDIKEPQELEVEQEKIKSPVELYAGQVHELEDQNKKD
jgi:uncharacterized protein HemX